MECGSIFHSTLALFCRPITRCAMRIVLVSAVEARSDVLSTPGMDALRAA